jgi:hypothetical protein
MSVVQVERADDDEQDDHGHDLLAMPYLRRGLERRTPGGWPSLLAAPLLKGRQLSQSSTLDQIASASVAH